MRIVCLIASVSLFLIMNSHELFADEIYAVKKGDSLYTVSKKFKVDIKKIREANNLDSNLLRPGTRLTIPFREPNAVKDALKDVAPEPVPGNKGDTKIPDDSNKNVPYHIVKKGDTPASISKRYSISVKDLMEINNIRKPTRLKIGQHIALKKSGPKTYIVKKGDNIWKIAKKLNLSVDEIVELNELETIKLKPGQKLLLEAWVEDTDGKNHTSVTSQGKFTEDLKALSESSELDTMSMNERAVIFAKKMLHIPYRFGGSTFMGIDCSAFVQKVFGFLNMPLPRTAREQFHIGEPVSKENLSIGDLVFFRTYASFPSHVGIYLGNNLFIHASSKDRKVTINNLDAPYYIKRFIGAKRLLFKNDTKEDKNTHDREG